MYMHLSIPSRFLVVGSLTQFSPMLLACANSNIGSTCPPG
ncbi:hypothetical protein Godav_003444, partial [Gossypium davidsonii]|nr:hypothetical protein [Gossypium davidsonii]MBA0661245.1 hypothetical protein [Gossypium klotzschianum]